jgi:hypothetical protein
MISGIGADSSLQIYPNDTSSSNSGPAFASFSSIRGGRQQRLDDDLI